MKYRFVAVITILSFVIGVVVGRYNLNVKAEKTLAEVEKLQVMMTNTFNEIEKTRAVESMDKTIEAVGYLVAIEDPYEDQSYLGQQFLNMVKQDLADLKKIDVTELDESSAKRIDFLKEKAEKLIEDIEFKYL